MKKSALINWRTTAMLLCFTALAGCCTTRSAIINQAADKAAITAFNHRYLQAINDGDSTALSRLTTEDHIMLPPGRPPLIGKAANDAANRRAFELFNIAESWTPEETEIAGDWAYQRGTYQVIATAKSSGTSRTTTGSFLRIYRRQADGSWLMTRDMFNSDRPPEKN